MELCRKYGAEIEFAENAHVGFERVKQVEAEEGRAFIHPFEGMRTALGTATLGLEFCEQVPPLDAVIVPIGGGDLRRRGVRRETFRGRTARYTASSRPARTR